MEYLVSIVLSPCFVGESGQIESCYVSQLALAAYLAEADPPKRETLHILATPSLTNHPLPVQLSTKERGKAYLGVPHIFRSILTFNTSLARDGLMSAELPIRSSWGPDCNGGNAIFRSLP